VEHPITWLGYVCVASAALAIAILARHLIKRPALTFHTKIVLLVGLGTLPAIAAVSSTVTGMQATTERHFCGSCHTMDAYVGDASDPESQSLAARHGRNPMFGDRNCYICHADYGMLGYPLTKLQGMKHVYMFYIAGWRHYSQEEALAKIHIEKPYDNANCRQCHSGTLEDWRSVPEHVSLQAELQNNRVSCASSGCHGFAHPFTKKDGAAALPKSAIGSDNPDRPISTALPPEAKEKVEEARAREAAERAAREKERTRDREAELERARKAARERSEKTNEKGEVKP
jgi:nitrate/TMAO reductase-like tetraheme cytochrome c subunit